MSGALDPQELRTWLLLWDKLLLPTNNVMHAAGGTDAEFLIREGVMLGEMVMLSGGYSGAKPFQDMREIVFNRLESVEPGDWALAFGERSFAFPDSVQGRGLQVQLAKALPVPDKDVPLQDVLEFRERRRAEMQALHACIDETYLSVLAAPDRPLAEHAAVEKLVRAADDQLALTREARFPFRLADLFADFNLAAASLAGMSSVAVGATFAAIVGNSLIAGATVSVAQIARARGNAKRDSPFAYVTAYHDELFPPD